MRTLLIAALVAAVPVSVLVGAVPAAHAGEGPSGRSLPYEVYAKGTIKETWRVDRDDVSDGCGRSTTGSGGSTWTWSMPKPKRLTLGVYTGFHSKPKVNVRVDRTGVLSTSESLIAGCDQPAPDTNGCGVKSFVSRLELDTGRPFALGLSDGDRELYAFSEHPGASCPLPGDFGPVAVLGERWETSWVLPRYGKNIRIQRVLFGGCDDGNRNCTNPKKVTTISFKKRVALPYSDGRGEYVAEIEWTIRFKRLFPLPPRV